MITKRPHSSSLRYIASPPTKRGHALLVLSLGQSQTHPRHPSSSPSPSPSPPSPISSGLSGMGSLASERTVVGWAARDATGHLSPYTYTVRYEPAGHGHLDRPLRRRHPSIPSCSITYHTCCSSHRHAPLSSNQAEKAENKATTFVFIQYI